MTREEAIQHFKEQLDIFGGEHAEAIKVAIEALKREPSEDLISRAETINAITETLDAIDHVPKWVFDKLTSAIEKLPSADRPKGKWHYSDGKPATIGQSFGVICDQCGAESEYCTNFCPNCGADMRGERE